MSTESPIMNSDVQIITTPLVLERALDNIHFDKTKNNEPPTLRWIIKLKDV